MTISYELAPMPKWYIADLTGKPLGAGSMFTYDNLDKTVFKFIYQDPGGNFPWPDPVLFDENGSQGPFYWAVDSTDPTALYYIEVYDKNGVLQWTIDNFIPPGGGGGSDITTAVDIENLIINNVFWRNNGNTANPVGTTFLILAPGANTGLTITGSATATPDIAFIKNNTAAADQLSFINFTLGSNALTGDVTPVQYLNYACNNSPSGETFKYVSFPITQGVQNLSNQPVTVTIWARCNSGNTQLTLQWYQFFGDGAGATPAVTVPIQTLTLTNSWQKFVITTTVPNVTGAVLGGCGNDGLFFQVSYPLGVATSIDFIKPCVYLGNLAPAQDYHTYDMIDGMMDTPRTGDVKTTVNNFQPFGWLAMNNGTIGSASSNASARDNIDTFPLYDMIWRNVAAFNLTFAPIFDSSGNPTTLGATSVADFTANKQLALLKALGQYFTGTAPGVTIPATLVYTADHSTDTLTLSSGQVAEFGGTGGTVFVTNTGGSPPTGLVTNTPYWVIQTSATTFKLATTLKNALIGDNVTFSDNGSGTQGVQVFTNPLGGISGVNGAGGSELGLEQTTFMNFMIKL